MPRQLDTSSLVNSSAFINFEREVQFVANPKNYQNLSLMEEARGQTLGLRLLRRAAADLQTHLEEIRQGVRNIIDHTVFTHFMDNLGALEIKGELGKQTIRQIKSRANAFIKAGFVEGVKQEYSLDR